MWEVFRDKLLRNINEEPSIFYAIYYQMLNLYAHMKLQKRIPKSIITDYRGDTHKQTAT
jgi:hypothetical protein